MNTTYYFDSEGEPVKRPAKGGYFRKVLKQTEAGYLVQDFYQEGKTKPCDPAIIPNKADVMNSFSSDIVQGLVKTYYPSGAPESEASYDQGKVQGAYQSWHENGQLSVQGQYQNSEKTGEWKWWYENGKPRIFVTYANGKHEGTFKRWHENGQLTEAGEHLNDYDTGSWTFSKTDGSRTATANFLEDRLNGSCIIYNAQQQEVVRTNDVEECLYLYLPSE